MERLIQRFVTQLTARSRNQQPYNPGRGQNAPDNHSSDTKLNLHLYFPIPARARFYATSSFRPRRHPRSRPRKRSVSDIHNHSTLNGIRPSRTYATYRTYRSNPRRARTVPKRPARGTEKVCGSIGAATSASANLRTVYRTGERERIQELRPDILLTNFMMLELLMTRQNTLDQIVVSVANDLDFIVLDDLHTYRGRQGADVAMLVRRIRDRLCRH